MVLHSSHQPQDAGPLAAYKTGTPKPTTSMALPSSQLPWYTGPSVEHQARHPEPAPSVPLLVGCYHLPQETGPSATHKARATEPSPSKPLPSHYLLCNTEQSTVHKAGSPKPATSAPPPSSHRTPDYQGHTRLGHASLHLPCPCLPAVHCRTQNLQQCTGPGQTGLFHAPAVLPLPSERLHLLDIVFLLTLAPTPPLSSLDCSRLTLLC